MQGLSVDMEGIRTNIVYFDVDPSLTTAENLAGQLGTEGVGVLPLGPRRLRAVTHYQIDEGHIDEALVRFGRLLGSRF